MMNSLLCQKIREITIDSYSESISSDDEVSDDRTITADSESSAAQSFEDFPCKLETDATKIEATLNQIACWTAKCCGRVFSIGVPSTKVNAL